MKSDQDRASYNNEFKDLQGSTLQHIPAGIQWGKLVCQLHYGKRGGTGEETLFNAASQDLDEDHTITIYTSAAGSAGSKVSVHKSLLLSALTVKQDKSLVKAPDITNGHWSDVWMTRKHPRCIRS